MGSFAAGALVGGVGRGLFSKPKTPAAPDYAAAARETSAGNLQAAQLNAQANQDLARQTAEANQALARQTSADNLNIARIGAVANRANQYNPYGSLTWEKGATDYDPWTQRVNFSQAGQQLFDLQNQQDMAYAQAASKGFEATRGIFENPNIDQSLLPAAPINAGTTAQQAMMSRLQPTLERNEEALRSRLANQGIGLGSAAYNREMNLQGQQANDLYLQSAMQGIGLDAAARERALNEAYTAQSRPLDLINSLRSGSQVKNPQFQSYSQQAGVSQGGVQQGGVQQQFTGGPNLMGAAEGMYGAQLDAANARNAYNNQMMQGLFSLGGAAMMSDKRLKKNIKKVGKTDGGLNIYTYEYIWGGPTQMGVMAQDVEKVDPSAVVDVAGYKAVNYSKVK